MPAECFELLDARGSLHFVTDLVHEDDVLCLALTCRALRDALWARFPRRLAGDAHADWHVGDARVRTRDAAVVVTATRLVWAWAARARTAATLPRGREPAIVPRGETAESVADIAMLQNPQFAAALDAAVTLGGQKSSEERALFTDNLLQQLRDGSLAGSLSSAEGQQQDLEVASRLRVILTLYTEIRQRDAAATRRHVIASSARPWLWQQAATTSIAARYGALATLQWLRENGCDWDTNTCRAAAEGGHLAVLQWARANGCDWNSNACMWAAKGGHLHVLQWARANGCDWDKHTCMWAAGGGHLHVLQWARANGCDWDHVTCMWAAKGGHLHVLQWARANGCDWSRVTCMWAAGGGHLPMLQWARANGCDWDHTTCTWAAKGGHLPVLQWARANGCDWNKRTCMSAARGGHLHVLQWARANGCAWSQAECLEAAPAESETRDWIQAQPA
jgi:hypothetical protein